MRAAAVVSADLGIGDCRTQRCSGRSIARILSSQPSSDGSKRACSSPPSCLSHTSHALTFVCCVRALWVCRPPRRVPSLPHRAIHCGRRGQADFHDEMSCLLPTPTPRGCARAVGHRLRLVSAACISLTGRPSPAARARAVSAQRAAADRMAPRTVGPLHTMNRLDRTSCMMGACTVLTLLMWQISARTDCLCSSII